MAYDKEKIYKQAKKVAKENGCIYIEEIVSFLPCGKTSFYSFFDEQSNELNALKEIIEDNKILTKTELRKKWAKSEAPALQISLMKICANEDELKRLAVNYNKTEFSPSKGISITFDDIESCNKGIDSEV